LKDEFFHRIQKYEQEGVTIRKANATKCIGILCFTDGAKHEVTQKSECDVIKSFLCVFTSESISNKLHLLTNSKIFSHLDRYRQKCFESVDKAYEQYFRKNKYIKIIIMKNF